MPKLADPSLEIRLRNKQGQTICARCRAVTTCTIMSMFSRDIICMDCEDLERLHPKFKEASLRERAPRPRATATSLASACHTA